MKQASRTEVLLIHQDEILHYRVALYNYLARRFYESGLDLEVLADGVDDSNPHELTFRLKQLNLGTKSVARYLYQSRPEVVIFFVNLKNSYLFPSILLCKILGIKVIYWGHGKDLEDPDAKLKNLLYKFEHSLADRIILYAPQLIEHISPPNRWKISIANNTLATTPKRFSEADINAIRERYNLFEKQLIIFVGRIQTRKRVADLIRAFGLINDTDVGLVLVGPDSEKLMRESGDRRIHYLGSLYGDEVYQLLQLADIYCIPGHVGLGIVDAFQYGLPIVTEDVRHAPEIMYLEEGENGFTVPSGDVDALCSKLKLLLSDGNLRKRMSAYAQETIRKKGSKEQMADGFLEAINSLKCSGAKSDK